MKRNILEVLFVTQGDLTVTNLFAYCGNDPVNNVDPSGYVSVGAIIGGIIGFGIGYIIMPIFANMLKLSGWRRRLFIAAGTAAVTTIGSLMGYYTGKALVAIYAKGCAFAAKLNHAIAKVIAKFTGATLKRAHGNGWVLVLRKVTLRIMTAGSQNNYFRISILHKGALTIAGVFSNNQSLTHIPINIRNIIKIIGLMFRFK